MLQYAALFTLLACLSQDGHAFFWKNRLVYSTIDPEPTWGSSLLQWCADVRQWKKDVSAGKITGPETWQYTTSVSQKLWGLDCREDWIKEATEYSVYKERLMIYLGNIFGQIWNIWGHKYQKHRLQFRNIKDWITAKVFLRDPKAVKNMLNNVEMGWFHAGMNDEYLSERWSDLWKDIKFMKYMVGRLSKTYFDYHYPDGPIRTRINDWLGIKNKLREEALKTRTTIKTKPTTTKIYDKYFFENYIGKDHWDKKKK